MDQTKIIYTSFLNYLLNNYHEGIYKECDILTKVLFATKNPYANVDDLKKIQSLKILVVGTPYHDGKGDYSSCEKIYHILKKYSSDTTLCYCEPSQFEQLHQLWSLGQKILEPNKDDKFMLNIFKEYGHFARFVFDRKALVRNLEQYDLIIEFLTLGRSELEYEKEQENKVILIKEMGAGCQTSFGLGLVGIGIPLVNDQMKFDQSVIYDKYKMDIDSVYYMIYFSTKWRGESHMFNYLNRMVKFIEYVHNKTESSKKYYILINDGLVNIDKYLIDKNNKEHVLKLKEDGVFNIYVPKNCEILSYSSITNNEFLNMMHFSGGESNIVGVTGDQSFFEALSLGKFPLVDYPNNKINSHVTDGSPESKIYAYLDFLKIITFLETETMKINTNHLDIMTDLSIYYEPDEKAFENYYMFLKMHSQHKADFIKLLHKYYNLETNLLTLIQLRLQMTGPMDFKNIMNHLGKK